MDIKVRSVGNIVVLDLNGVIDVNSANLVEVVGQCIRDGYIDILCNLEDINSVDYMGMSVIAIAYKEVINNKGRMKLVNVPMHIKNLFCITGLDRAIEIFTDENMALSSFEEDRIIENIKKMQLRRRFKRLPIEIKVKLRTKNASAPVCMDADIMNLSGVGAYLYGCESLKLGDEVVLTFNSPERLSGMSLEAKIVWLCDKQIQPQLYPGMGVAFHNIERASQAKLIDYIEKNLSRLTSSE